MQNSSKEILLSIDILNMEKHFTSGHLSSSQKDNDFHLAKIMQLACSQTLQAGPVWMSVCKVHELLLLMEEILHQLKSSK